MSLAECYWERQHSQSLHKSHIVREFICSSYKLQSKHTAHIDDNCTLNLFVLKFIRNLVAALQKDTLKKKILFPVLCCLSEIPVLGAELKHSAKTVSFNWNFSFSFFFFFFFKLLVIFRGFVKYLMQCYIPNPKGFWACRVIKRQYVNLPVKQSVWIFYYYFNSGLYLRRKMSVFLRSYLSHLTILILKLNEHQTNEDARLLSHGECSPREWTS